MPGRGARWRRDRFLSSRPGAPAEGSPGGPRPGQGPERAEVREAQQAWAAATRHELVTPPERWIAAVQPAEARSAETRRRARARRARAPRTASGPRRRRK